LAKKSQKRKRATKAKARKTARKPARRTAKKAKASKRKSAKRSQPKAARKKVAARAAATRKRKPEQEKTNLQKATSIARGAALTAVNAITRRMPWSKDENDPINLLMADHRRFEKLLDEGEKSTERSGKGRREILDALASELSVHEAIEEQVLYPALEPHPEARKTALEGYEEHHVADAILNELKDVRTNDETWAAKFKVLKENITHHISEEERMMFPAARGVLETEELLALGARMRALKSQLER
jgi:iron-sulfur cluster repair protein YtfE (RIC family)